MLRKLQLRRFSTESHFTWQLDVKAFVEYSCKIAIWNPKRLLRKQQKNLGGYFFAAPSISEGQRPTVGRRKRKRFSWVTTVPYTLWWHCYIERYDER